MRSRLPGPAGASLADTARAAFTHGLDWAAAGAAVAMLLAAGLTAVFLRGIRPAGQVVTTAEPAGATRRSCAA